MLGASASEAKLREASASNRLSRARYVHFATHGVLGMDRGQLPALVLGQVGNSQRRDELGTDDGLLQLDEITRLKLNADLVVLSACRSGRGRMRSGEGVSSLARAFLIVGCRGVVCSLWGVADRETADLFTAVYGGLKDGRTSAEASARPSSPTSERARPPSSGPPSSWSVASPACRQDPIRGPAPRSPDPGASHETPGAPA